MNELLDTIISKRNDIQTIKIYFGNNTTNNLCLLDCTISNDIVDRCLSQFIGYSNTKNEFKQIIALDKELIITKKNSTCKQFLVDQCDFVTVPDLNNKVCIMTEKIKTLSEIEFPCKKNYNKVANCMEYVFNVHAKVKLVIHIENNTNSLFLEAIVDDYIDTTIQYLKDGIIQTISSLLK